VQAAASLRVRIAAAIVVTAALAIAGLALAVLAIGSEAFAVVMRDHGVDAAEAHAMFDHSVAIVTIAAGGAAIAASVALAVWMGSRISSPLIGVAAAARRIAAGDYATRVRRAGPEEVVSVADSFNQMAAALEEQERLRREFIANAAHELRTPLTNLTGYLEALRDGIVAPDDATFRSLLEETGRLVRLAESLDTLAEGDEGSARERRASVDIAVIIRAALDLARPSFDRSGIRVEVDVPETLAAEGDADALAQVVANLLQNARRYTPAGGTVTVRAERRPADLLMTMTNTGEGIPAHDLPHVFERFYRVDKSRDAARGGSGIGLAIVQQHVERAGGRVGVESRAGLTRFWFSLPTASASDR
jgi:two-component system, OmpR family, sensor histidine kinase BaeS